MTRILLYILILITTNACNNNIFIPRAGIKIVDDNNSPEHLPPDRGADLIKGPAPAIKNFQEVFSNMWNLTELDPEEHYRSLRNSFVNVRQSLSVEGIPESLTSNQVLILTHLAFRFCERQIDNSNDQESFFSGSVYASIGGNETPQNLWASNSDRFQLIDFFMGKFGVTENTEETRNELNRFLEDMIQLDTETNSASSLQIMRALCTVILTSSSLFI